LINTGSDDYLKSDWPIPVDLSYSNADLLAAGIGGFPIGDLNWFPTRKAAWMAQRDVEYSTIEAAMQAARITAVKNVDALPAGFALEQNYPNPFNPSTMIGFTIPKAGYVTLKVYDILGREVQTLVNERQNAGNHSVTFSASNLPSGMYFYRLQAGNYSATKKLLLLK
jgi:hypothetical protein